MNAPVLEVTALKKHFPVRKGLLRRSAGTVFAVDGVSVQSCARRDVEPGRRKRLRKVDLGAHGDAADRADKRHDPP